MLMSTRCLALLAPMVIPGSQYSNFIFNFFFKARVQIKIVVVVVYLVAYGPEIIGSFSLEEKSQKMKAGFKKNKLRRFVKCATP